MAIQHWVAKLGELEILSLWQKLDSYKHYHLGGEGLEGVKEGIRILRKSIEKVNI